MVQIRVFTRANRKGGTAKTTTVVNLAYGLTEYNKRVLVIDLDNQGHVMLGLKALASNDDVNDLSLPNHSLFSRVVKCSPMLYVASVDVDIAYAALRGKVDLVSPARSRLVQCAPCRRLPPKRVVGAC